MFRKSYQYTFEPKRILHIMQILHHLLSGSLVGIVKSNKEKVYEYIITNPGCYFRQIKRELNIGTGDLQHNLYILEKEGMISSKSYGLYKHFFPSKNFEEKQKDVLSILSQESPREILLFLTNNPGSNQRSVANHIKTSSPTALWYLRKLEELGVIWSRRQGREMRYYAAISSGEISSLLKTHSPRMWHKWADRLADTLRTLDKSSEENDD